MRLLHCSGQTQQGKPARWSNEKPRVNRGRPISGKDRLPCFLRNKIGTIELTTAMNPVYLGLLNRLARPFMGLRHSNVNLQSGMRLSELSSPNLWRSSIHLLLLLISLCLNASGVAASPCQSPVFQHSVKAKKAQSSFAAVTAKLQRHSLIRAQFSQHKKIKVLRFPLRSQGRLLYSRKHGIVWQQLRPFATTFLITPQGIWQRQKRAAKKIQSRDKPIVHGFTRIFLAMFSGNPKQLKKHFRVFFRGNSTGWKMGLLPRQALMRRMLQCIVVQGSDTVQQVQLSEPNGDRTTIKMTNIRRKPPTLSALEKRQFKLSP